MSEPLPLNDRLRLTIGGAVQGVGFRPFVYRLAKELALCGWITNTVRGVTLEVEGDPRSVKQFRARLHDELPPLSSIQSLESKHLDPVGFAKFEIRESNDTGARSALVVPDIATCTDCLAEIHDPTDRRYRYPFTNCTNCGPRYSIIEALPYDRGNTTMKAFTMCAECRTEYEDPANRRFHAQPNACPACGPHVELWSGNGEVIAQQHQAIVNAADAVRSGKIIAVKGIGGFHLMADARNDDAVNELRRRKHREEKPFAVMFPSLDALRAAAKLSDTEARMLTSPESPIGIVRRSRAADSAISVAVAPNNPYIGALLPYTPLHHLLVSELDIPVIATSGNLSDEPICIDEHEALKRLGQIADFFLVHDRPIERHVDDSIVREVAGREMVIRRARGFAPLPVRLGQKSAPIVAVGANLKNAVSISSGDNAFVSQHIGDLETPEAYRAFTSVIRSLEQLYDISPSAIACDAHPDYLSTKFAVNECPKPISVQHHYAHVLSCMAENEVEAPALGVAWDGTGFGSDGTIWGGEFLKISSTGFERFAHLRTFRLPGGDKAVKEPRRSAIGLLFEIFGEKVFAKHELFPVISFMPAELKMIRRMLVGGINSPTTSSAGRLFDAVSSIIGLRERIRFEGQAAMELEFLADQREDGVYPFGLTATSPIVIDWEPLILELISDTFDGVRPSRAAARFHNTLVEIIVRVAIASKERSIALSGGCFQNKYLIERAIRRLREEGLSVYWHQRIPTNDGGIALGQTVAAAIALREAAKNRRAGPICV